MKDAFIFMEIRNQCKRCREVKKLYIWGEEQVCHYCILIEQNESIIRLLTDIDEKLAGGIKVYTY